MTSISLENLAVQAFIFYSAILALKVLGMAMLTGKQRYSRKIFANPEDVKGKRGAKISYDDQEVERVRRAHLNDLENITPFWILGALYLTTDPSVWLATQLFRVFTLGRLIHTFVYAVVPIPQPARAIAFGFPYLVNIYMGVQVVLYYLTAL